MGHRGGLEEKYSDWAVAGEEYSDDSDNDEEIFSDGEEEEEDEEVDKCTFANSRQKHLDGILG